MVKPRTTVKEVGKGTAPDLGGMMALLYPAFVGALNSASKSANLASVFQDGVSVNGIPYSGANGNVPCSGSYSADSPAVISAGILVKSAGYEPQRFSVNITVQPGEPLSCSWEVLRNTDTLASGSRKFFLNDMTPLQYSLRNALASTLRRTDVNPCLATVLTHYLS